MKVLGALDLVGNMLKNPSLEAIENFPTDSAPGRLIFKDKRVMICVDLDIDLPVWIPLTAQINTHIHDQNIAATTWTISHRLNSSNTIVQVIGPDGKHVVPDEVTQTLDETIITFINAQAGRAILMLGQEEGYDRLDYAFTAEFDSPSTQWVVNHMLGVEPIIRAFVGNQEVQPLSIVHNSVNQATVTFSLPQVGRVRAL